MTDPDFEAISIKKEVAVQMKYENVKKLTEEKFKRITGVKKSTFSRMVEILTVELNVKLAKGGRKPKLEIEEMLLATLEYLREYRTYAHIAIDYGLDESNMYRTIKWVEDTLIKDGTFSLPGKKELLKNDMEYEVVLVDATESPIERPKKNKENTTQEKRKNIH